MALWCFVDGGLTGAGVQYLDICHRQLSPLRPLRCRRRPGMPAIGACITPDQFLTNVLHTRKCSPIT